jgi:two-component system copper resistance phosphate regulon response regulator CusR
MKILIIDDNIKTSDYLCMGLKEHFYTPEAAHDGQEGLFLALQHRYDLIILDVMMPKLDGWSLVQRLREAGNQTPVIFLTALGNVTERIKGIELGGDDYLVKPFSFSELLVRIQAILRRCPHIATDMLEIGDLKIDLLRHKAMRGHLYLNLTAKEFMLLSFFAKKTGQVLSRTYIAEQVWDINFDSDTNAIDVAMKRLRDKVDLNFETKLIHTVRGAGYVLEKR